jgi:hypothetical protein
MGRGASLHTTLAALLLLLQLVTRAPAAVLQAVVMPCEATAACAAAACSCAGLCKAADGLTNTVLLCCTWCWS